MRSSKPVFDCGIAKNHLLLETSLRGEIGIIKNRSIFPKIQKNRLLYILMRQIKSRIRMVWDGKSKIKDDLLLWHIKAYFKFKSSNGEKSAFF